MLSPVAPFVTPPLPAPANQNQAAPRPAAPHPFAELLRQSRPAVAAEDTPPPAPEDAPEEDGQAPDAAHREPTPKPRGRGAAGNRAAQAAGTLRPGETPDASAIESARASRRGDAIDGGGAALPVPWLASLQAPTTRFATALEGGDAAAAPNGKGPPARAEAAARDAAFDAAGAAESRRGAADAMEATEAGAHARFDATVAAATARLEPALATANSSLARPGEGAAHTESTATAGTLLAAFQPAPGLAPAAPTQAMLPTPFGAPDFATSLGLQVSLFAKGGIQRAELHLNPPDMGPVSIQIAIDGTQARVDFGADAAATRQAIEAGLPELASALREAGLTLQGGGVSQHSRGHDSGSGDAPSHGSRSRELTKVEGLEAVRTPPRLRGLAGGVDLYA